MGQTCRSSCCFSKDTWETVMLSMYHQGDGVHTHLRMIERAIVSKSKGSTSLAKENGGFTCTKEDPLVRVRSNFMNSKMSLRRLFAMGSSITATLQDGLFFRDFSKRICWTCYWLLKAMFNYSVGKNVGSLFRCLPCGPSALGEVPHKW